MVMKEDLMRKTLQKLFQAPYSKLGIRGLRRALCIIKSLTADLDQELESTKQRNLDVKERKLEKIWNKRNKEQLLLPSNNF